VAVHATQEGVDPVGSCVGVRGGRIQNVVNELGGEKIDIVQWDPAVTVFVANSLSPAKVMNVLLDENPETGKTATVIVPDRQLSLAIGKEGQNARLAAKLTGWRIDIKSATEAAEETLGRLEDSTLPPEEMDLLSLAEVILHKRDLSELTEEEQALIEGQVGSAPEAAPGSTDEEPEAAAEPTAEVDQEPVPDEVPAAVDEAMPDSEVKAGAADGLEPGAEASEAEPIVEPADLEPADGLPDDSEVQSVDEDSLPVIDGEPIEATLGWVVTETSDDLYSGWDDYVEETPAVETEQWEREEFTEEERAPKQPARKTKKKKRGRRPRTSRRESNW
jgi:transcription antitermination factor NusA-like protein